MSTSVKKSLRELYAAHVAHLRLRYAVALEDTGYAAVVLHSGSTRLRSQFDDNYWPLRVVPHFAHWVPLEWADCALVVEHKGEPRLVATRDRSFWERAPEPDWEHFSKALDVREVDDADEARLEIDAARVRGKVALIAEDPKAATRWGFADEDVNPKELVLALDQIRVKKTEYEVECILEANRRAALGHHAIAERFLRGDDVSELDLHLFYLAASRQDAMETPYKSIVAQNDAAAILHHVHYGRTAPKGDRSLLVDAGATCMGYASDVTRTYVLGGGEVAATFREIVRRLDALQRHACARIELGMPYEALHDGAHRELASLLSDLGLVRLSEEDLVARGVTRLFFPHGLGHSLGLQTHDVGCLVAPPRPENPWLRNTTPIAVDQVFTVEPGVYFIDTLLEKLRASPEGAAVHWKMVDALRAFGGVRVEDDVHIRDGHGGPIVRNLTREALGD